MRKNKGEEAPYRIKEVKLTKTEIEIINLIADGKTSNEIALLRNRKLSTIKHQRWLLMKKSGLKNIAEVVRWVMERENI
jgi:DNA-binding NarL/FixJ family response regulator